MLEGGSDDSDKLGGNFSDSLSDNLSNNLGNNPDDVEIDLTETNNFFFAQLLGSMIGVKIIIGSKKYFACG
jgi:hypothetical protein